MPRATCDPHGIGGSHDPQHSHHGGIARHRPGLCPASGRAEAAYLVLLGRDAGALAETSKAHRRGRETADVFVANVTERTRLAEVAHGLVWLLDPADTMQVDQCLNRDGA